MLPVTGISRYFMRRFTHYGSSLIFLCCVLVYFPCYSETLNVQSFSIRARVSEQTLLGDDAQEEFDAYDVSANLALPWNYNLISGWGLGTRLMSSAGLLRGAGEEALVLSLIPELTLKNKAGRFLLDVGAGGTLFSRERFGTQDFGGPFQFALTLGVGVPVYNKLAIGYRFMHYSDAGLNGSDTTGADLHMIEFTFDL